MKDDTVRRGQGKALLGDGLRRIAGDAFGSSSVDGGKVIAAFGALRNRTTWIDGTRLFVDTEMDPSVDAVTAAETIRRYNAFLERAMGYTAKERAKRAQARAKAGARAWESLGPLPGGTLAGTAGSAE